MSKQSNVFRFLFLLLLGCLWLIACDSADDADDDESPTEQSDDDNDDSANPADDDDDTTPAGRDGLPGWHILGPDYEEPDPIDGMSFEWDYFMVHNEDGSFTGSVGYLIANPRHRTDLFGSLVPQGGNTAIAGQFADDERVAEYKNFGYDHFSASAEIREFSAEDTASGQFGRMTPLPEENALRLEGRTANFEWDLHVSQDWPELSGGMETFVPEHGDDVGKLRPTAEQWNVDMLWPLTKVVGTITNRQTDEEIVIDGHGYRENSWGRWAFNLGGWDFAVATDRAAQVSWAWQTYHFESTELDYLDLGFVRDGELHLEHFRADAGQLGWRHDDWRFDAVARQCVPRDALVIAQNDRYRVEATVTVDVNEAPMLSDATVATKWFVIFILFPHVSGTIVDRETEEVVAEFNAQGGGEFSVYRTAQESMTDAECATWGETFQSPLP
ncbi:MAG: hypothetical protein GX444_18620 [Myxococcales bacterium]|nr:hypothetical protein [Myxococcales bacterium]